MAMTLESRMEVWLISELEGVVRRIHRVIEKAAETKTKYLDEFERGQLFALSQVEAELLSIIKEAYRNEPA